MSRYNLWLPGAFLLVMMNSRFQVNEKVDLRDYWRMCVRDDIFPKDVISDTHPPVITGLQTSATKSDTLPARYGFGRVATAAEITRLDIDVRPDGKGLPPGQGQVVIGKQIFATKCAACHGSGGIGGPNGSLVTTANPARKRPEKTIGNYWPYATTVFDYIRRAMPFSQPGTLTDDEVYHLTAYLLQANGIIDEKTVINAQTLPRVVMPAQKLFVPDDRTGGLEIR